MNDELKDLEEAMKKAEPMTLHEACNFLAKIASELPEGSKNRKAVEAIGGWLTELENARVRLRGHYDIPRADISELAAVTNEIAYASYKLAKDICPEATDEEKEEAVDRIVRAAERFAECKPRNCDVYLTRQHMFEQLEKMCQGKSETECNYRNCLDCVAEWVLAAADRETYDP